MMKGFRVTDGKGFQVTFPNGWTVSVQFGPCNYGEHYHAPFVPNLRAQQIQCGAEGSNTAEVWCFQNGHSGAHWPEDPLGWQTPEQVAQIMAYAASGVFPDPETRQ